MNRQETYNQVSSVNESVILVASDLHYGKETPEFNTSVFETRMNFVKERCCKEYCKKYEKLVIFILGDVNDGTDIYRGQSHYQAVSDVEQQAIELADFMWRWLNDLADVWKRVEVYAVCGNHGRAGIAAHERANWDLVAYRYIDLGNNNNRVTITYSKENMFMQVVQLYGHGYLLYHGHDILQYQTIPWYGILQRVLRWGGTDRLNDWSVVAMGHFHTMGYWPVNKTHILLTGTLVSGEEWAFRRYGMTEQTKWWLVGCNEEEPIAWLKPINIKEAGHE